MKKFLLFTLITIILLTSCANSNQTSKTNSEDKAEMFITNMTKIIPQPKKDQFSDYHVMINYFFKSVNDNDLESALKCFAVNEEYSVMDSDLYFKRVKVYKLNKDAPIPTNYSHNFFVTFSKYESYWQKYFMRLMLYSNPGLIDLNITEKTNNWQSELQKVKSIKTTKKYAIPKITFDKTAELNVIDQAMNASEKRVIDVTLNVENGKDEIAHALITIVKINGNWKMFSMGD
ncbi:MAG TPA: hypothetical protein VF941_09835 [Clostridia bacterium]